MDASRSLLRSTGPSRLLRASRGSSCAAARDAKPRRWIQVSTFPGNSSQPDNLPINASAPDSDGPDARFEVLGAPYSLLSASLSASQTLYTRRGTLVGLSGKAENVVSSLSTLEPFRRAVLGMPFFYQKITSASPVTALISSKSPLTSFTVVHLDGTVDWIVAQRRALLAWTGQTLSITPTVNYSLSVGYWGNSRVTGRGLVGLVGNGQIYELVLGAGESYVAHPGNILAYTLTRSQPTPYRFKSNTLKLDVPGLSNLARFLPDTRFFRVIRESDTWRLIGNFFYTLRTWSRRTFFGDRLFLRFEGPATLLLQTRGSRLRDVLSAREINEVADTPPGAIADAIKVDLSRDAQANQPKGQPPAAMRVTSVSVGRGGEVKFDDPARNSVLP